MTPAEKTVAYCLQRVVRDDNFRWYMIGTEALRLCIESEASRRGVDASVVEEELYVAIEKNNERLERQGESTKPEVVRLREKLSKVSDVLGAMQDDGSISMSAYREIIQNVE